MTEDRRCPNCGALVAAEAEWCGQCYASLAPGSEPEPEFRTRPRKGAATWPCPVCEAENPIELDACATCATPFAALMRRPDPGRGSTDPKEAAIRSLIFPGLGHRMLGRGGEGLSRSALFVVTAGMLALFVSSGAPSGPGSLIVAIYAVFSLVVYFGTAAEAYRLAGGGGPFLTGRGLVWALSGLILVTVLLLALVVTQASSG